MTSEMPSRIADLNAAIESGQPIVVARQNAFAGQPDRLLVSFENRRLVFPLSVARELSDGDSRIAELFSQALA